MAFTAPQTLAFLQSAFDKHRLPHAILVTSSSLEEVESLVVELVNYMNKTQASMWGNIESEYCRLVRPKSRTRRILIEDIREIEPFFQQKALPGKWKIGIFLEAEMLNENAENAFLKTLEEPPQNSFIVLVTVHPEQLMTTIRSRCVRVDVYNPERVASNSPLVDSLLPAWLMLMESLGSEVAAMAFRMELATQLTSLKEGIRARCEKEVKMLSKEIAKSSGVLDWESQQEGTTTATIEMEYLQARDAIFDFMIAWLGDVLTHQAGGMAIRFPEYETYIQNLMTQETIPSLLRRIEAIEQLRADLKTNVHEQIALDVGLLRAFA